MNIVENIPVFCAIDTPDLDRARALAAAMERAGCGLKLGLEFFNAQGPQGVAEIRRAYEDLPLFLDLKFHDIPNTVAGAVRAVTRLGPAYMNVHASGGTAMMIAAHNAAAEEADKIGLPTPKILGVTLLTSLDEDTLTQVGYRDGLEERVVQLARLTRESGLAGVVCSAREIAAVRGACGPDFVLMGPGIRPVGAAHGDQKRVMTPSEALHAGATHLVIGRPITAAPDPENAARRIMDGLS
ncbi:MAG: orotidine-5'-phosphate decarboxylase [Alphaproteobacteria bacterium]|nr:orotidine-5'-phosphate decarboxylase [Alphaproteobacteria bacterium]